ncbi:hypothetical protein BX666DRAFT_1458514 [Dichotomocladium elegans]|nr:hypothetical protein BX666DRAFT_1458514 [Dichotomocladium elegans]
MSSIRAIDQYSVHRICSGQVILDLSMAVKELVENSLDAGATTIEVKFKENGLERIEVSDDGSGIDSSNYEALALKHHTSKIASFEDLASVRTFGFRGEALSSLCALGELVVTTSTKDKQPLGVKLTYDASGKLVSSESVARNSGTTVQVSKLFHTLPVRKQEFRRNIKKEYPKAIAILQAYSLISRGTRLIVSNQPAKGPSTQVLVTRINKTIRDNIINVFGTKILQQILPYDIEFTLENGNLVKIEGFISKPLPGCGRSATDRQYLYVNGRPCLIPKIAKAINDAYRSQVPSQYPFIIANFIVKPSTYDVNVTPDKREILLHDSLEISEKLVEKMSQHLQSTSTVELNTSGPSLPRSIPLQPCPRPDTLNSDSTTTASHTQDDGDPPRPSSAPPSGQDSSGSHATSRLQSTTITGKPAWLSAVQKTVQSSNSQVTRVTPMKKRQASVLAFVTKKPRTTPPIASDEQPAESHCSSAAESEMVDELGEEEEAEEAEAEEEIPTASFCEGGSIPVWWITHGQERKLRIDDDAFLPKIRASALEGTRLQMQLDCPSTQLVESANVFASSSNDEVVEDALSRVIHKHDFSAMKVIGQFNRAFILVLLDGYDMFIVDQHASDEKYNFEQLQLTTPMEGQRLVVPHRPELTVSEELVAIENADILRKNGFEIHVDNTEMPGRRIKVHSQPMSNTKLFDKKDFSELIHLLTENPGQMVTCSSVRAMFASRACRKSYMFGDPLQLAQMDKIIKHMGEIEHPWNCPHGRPTVRHLHRLQRDRPNVPGKRQNERKEGQQ